MSAKRLTNVTYPHGCVVVSSPHVRQDGEPSDASDGWDHVLTRNGKCLGEFTIYGDALAEARKANAPPDEVSPDEIPSFIAPSE